VKKILQIPFLPLIGGSSPLWIQIEEILNPASALQYPSLFENLFALQFLGQKLQFFSSDNGFNNSLKSNLFIRLSISDIDFKLYTFWFLI